MRKAVIAALVVTLFGPASCLAGMAVLVNPAAQASCLPGAGLSVGAVPDHLDATTSDGTGIRLGPAQLTHAATIIDTGGRTDGVGREGVIVALMAALTESSLRMLSNTGAYPESANYPHDGNGGDHDSLGLFQMRPSTGWGTVVELMDPTYQARAFFGGPAGPNHGSPRGLLDIPGWRQMPPGAAAQAVEVSAYPDRYARFLPVAETILNALTRATSISATDGPALPETGRVVFPLPAGTWVRTSGFGIRVHPVTGVRKLHTGVDFAAPTGTPILAAADGRVASAGPATGYGNLIVIEHTVNGHRTATAYAHMTTASILVSPGDEVTAGKHIADVGAEGYTTGPHLHFEVRPGGADAAPVDPEPWLATQGAVDLDASGADQAGGCGDSVGQATPFGRHRSRSVGRRPDQRWPDHRPHCARPGPGPRPFPNHGLGLLVAAARHPIRASARPGLRRHLRKLDRPRRHRPGARAGVESRRLAQGQRPDPRRRVPDLARTDLVGRQSLGRMASLRRRWDARPHRCHRRTLRPRALHLPIRSLMQSCR